MSVKFSIDKCPHCNSRNYQVEEKPIIYDYKGKKIRIKTPSHWCDDCGNNTFQGTDHVRLSANLSKGNYEELS